LCGHVPWASGWPGGLTDEPQSATLRRPVHAAADTERCCGDRLFEAHFDEVRGQWEERFERGYGFWRSFVDEEVLRYLDCGLYENGFARIRCPDCAEEYLLAFSCKTRELCPSCAAKRSAATAALLAEDVLEEVGRAQWVFVIPKMLRPYFLHHRELLGELARAGWETVLELMVAAVDDATFRPGMVAVVQTSGDRGNWHPHVHALVSRGKRRKAEAEKGELGVADTGLASRAAPAETRNARALRRSWARLIKRIYEVDPLLCPSCGGAMKVIAFITEHEVVDAILRHLERGEAKEARGPPGHEELEAVS